MQNPLDSDSMFTIKKTKILQKKNTYFHNSMNLIQLKNEKKKTTKNLHEHTHYRFFII